MIILSKDKRQIININNLTNITIMNEYGQDEEINTIKCSSIVGKANNRRICLGIYETEERANEILLDIYSKLVENKNNYRLPEE